MSETLKFGNGEWATKEGSTLAYNDDNGNFKPLPFTFDRSTSATRVNKEGLIEVVSNNEPRIDFLNDSKGALLLEPSRSNLITYSEDFLDSSWIKSIATVNLTSEIAPDGTDDSVYSFIGADANLYTNTQSSSLDYTISFYVKSNGNGKDVFKLRLGSDFSQVFTATNQWVKYTFNATPSSQVFGISSNDIDSDILIWGAQLEQGSYATSYIPTQGSIGTRVAESCNQTPPSGIIGLTQGGVVYMDFIAQNTGSSSQSHFWLGASGNEIGLYGGNQFIFYSSGGVSINGGNVITGQRYKVAFAYETNDYVAYVNGVQVGSDNSATYPNMNNVFINSYFNGTEIQKKEIKDFKIYNTRLSNSELQQLTS